ncbi:restriction endonuclease subunit S [Myxococcota bacterium]|nr:restriction endonuclease subunit S [Myxococcota bacterium]
MADRPIKTIAEVCSEVVDCPHSTPKWTECGIVVLRSRNIRGGRLDLAAQPSFTTEADYKKRVKRAAPRAGDLVITREAPMGEVCMIPPGLRCCLGQRMVLLRPDDARMDGRYLLFALQSPEVQHQIRAHEGTGSTVSNLRIPALESLGIPAPPLDEQRRIAAVLGALDDKIELNRKMNRTLEEMAQAIFKSWFIDFDGHDDLVDSEIGPVPRGWEVKPIGDAVRVVGGSTPSTKEPAYWEGGTHAWATPKDLSGLAVPVLLGTERQVTDAGLQKISSGLLPAGTFLLSSRAPIGYTAISQVPTAINQGFIAIPPGGELTAAYLLFWTRFNMDSIKGRAGGTTFAEISKAAFRPIPVVVPPQGRMVEFERLVGPLIGRVVANARESTILAALRDTLLPKLISGELRVPEAEEAVGAASPPQSQYAAGEAAVP